MNHREPPQVPQGMRRTGQFLALLLVAAAQGTASATAHAEVLTTSVPQTGSAMESGGYLPSHGAPPLRFSEIVVPADPAPLVAVAAPSNPVPSSAPATQTAMHSGDHPLSADVTVHAPVSAEATVVAASPDAPAPLAILPDETRPQVRAEDFLPFFQAPGSGQYHNVNVVAPGQFGSPINPPPIPSSATYIQK